MAHREHNHIKNRNLSGIKMYFLKFVYKIDREVLCFYYLNWMDGDFLTTNGSLTAFILKIVLQTLGGIRTSFT